MARPHTSVRALLKHLKRVDGVSVEETGKKHLRVVDDDGDTVGLFSASPSDWRGLKNSIQKMKQAGLDLETHTYNKESKS